MLRKWETSLGSLLLVESSPLALNNSSGLLSLHREGGGAGLGKARHIPGSELQTVLFSFDLEVLWPG